MLLVFSSIFVASTKILGYIFVAPLGEAKSRNVEINIFKNKKKKENAKSQYKNGNFSSCCTFKLQK